jgi:CheY-like chemotaxis protein
MNLSGTFADEKERVPPASCHILVLEDEPAVQRVVVSALQKAGYSHVSVSSSIAGARQCWQAQTGKFDLFLTDFSLPDGSATAFIQELLRAKGDLRVILMTGFSEEFLGFEGSITQTVKLLGKPFRPAELLEAVSAQTGELRAT